MFWVICIHNESVPLRKWLHKLCRVSIWYLKNIWNRPNICIHNEYLRLLDGLELLALPLYVPFLFYVKGRRHRSPLIYCYVDYVDCVVGGIHINWLCLLNCDIFISAIVAEGLDKKQAGPSQWLILQPLYWTKKFGSSFLFLVHWANCE